MARNSTLTFRGPSLERGVTLVLLGVVIAFLLFLVHDYSQTTSGQRSSPVPMEAAVIFALVLILAVVMLQRQRREVESAEARLQAFLEFAPAAVVVTDAAGKILIVNIQTEEFFGYRRRDLIGKSLDFLVTPEAREKYRADFAQFLERARSERQGAVEESVCKCKDGTEIEVEMRHRLLEMGGERLILTGLRDIGQTRRLEEQLRQAQKMEAIGRMAGGIAHDFNNLLTIICGYCETLQKKLPAKDTNRATIEEIGKAGERAASLTRQLLAFSRKQVLQPRVLDLNALIVEIERMFQRLLGANIELRTELASDLGSVKADPGQMEQVLLNLAVNARDAIQGSGTLTIKTANSIVGGSRTRHVHVPAGSYVTLVVSDTGMGMDDRTRKHLFEPFFTTKEMGKGTGLGLATVYGIVRQSGGYIFVDSELGKGSTFTVYLPRVDEPAKKKNEEQRVEPAPARGSETVLIVEDEEGVRDFMATVLKEEGYGILEAKDGKEALACGDKHRDHIDLILVDVVMPQLGGADLARQFLGKHPETKVILMSGYIEDSGIRNDLGEPTTPFLQKPFSPQTLLQKVHDVLRA